MNDGAFSTVLVERFVEPIPVALKPDEEYRKNEVHVFVEDTLIEERVKSNFCLLTSLRSSLLLRHLLLDSIKNRMLQQRLELC
jgi:hypothetical protein